jgi:GntR family transcriptional repressor for pyruvate dehydrogenase complex
METPAQEEYRMLSQMASDKIKAYVVENNLKAGDQLPTERNLAEVLEVSRPVIREALGTLEALGLIVKKQGKGIFLKDPNFSVLFNEMMTVWKQDENSLEQLLNFRIILEQASVEHIIEHSQPGDLESLYEIIVQSEQPAISFSEFIKLDYLFHRKLLSLTRSPLFTQLTDVINKYFYGIETKKKLDGSVPDYPITIKQHRRIVELLQAKDKEGAAQMLKVHLSGRS